MTFAIVPRIAFLVAAVCAGAPAQAQGPVINVYFEPLRGGEYAPLNKAIQAALSQPPLQLAAKPFAGALVVTVPDRVDVSHKKVSGTAYSFTVAFSRDGSSLGHSQQSCTSDKLSDCTEQLVLDVKSVAAPR